MECTNKQSNTKFKRLKHKIQLGLEGSARAHEIIRDSVILDQIVSDDFELASDYEDSVSEVSGKPNGFTFLDILEDDALTRRSQLTNDIEDFHGDDRLAVNMSNRSFRSRNSSDGSFENGPSLFTKLKVYSDDDEQANDSDTNGASTINDTGLAHVNNASSDSLFHVDEGIRRAAQECHKQVSTNETLSRELSNKEAATPKKLGETPILESPLSDGSIASVTEKIDEPDVREEKKPLGLGEAKPQIVSITKPVASPTVSKYAPPAISLNDLSSPTQASFMQSMASNSTVNTPINQEFAAKDNVSYKSTSSNQNFYLTGDYYNQVSSGLIISEEDYAKTFGVIPQELDINCYLIYDKFSCYTQLMLPLEIEFFNQNIIPKQKLLYAKYFLFKFINSNERIITVNGTNPFKLLGEFLNDKLFIPKNIWNLNVIVIKNCKVKENIVNDLNLFLNNIWNKLYFESFEKFNFKMISSSLVYYQKLLSAFDVYENPDEEKKTNVSSKASAEVSTTNTSVNPTSTSTASSKKNKHKRFSSFNFYKKRQKPKTIDPTSDSLAQPSSAGADSVVSELASFLNVNPSDASLESFKELQDNVIDVEDKRAYLKSLNALFEVVSKITNFAMYLECTISRYQRGTKDFEEIVVKYNFIERILKFLSNYVVKFILIDVVSLAAEYMKLESAYFRSNEIVH